MNYSGRREKVRAFSTKKSNPVFEANKPVYALAPFRALGGYLAILVDGTKERLVRFLALPLGNHAVANAPELLDGADAPQSALSRSTNRLFADDDVHRVGVHLRELPQGNP